MMRSGAGFSRVEALLAVFVLGLLVAVLWPAWDSWGDWKRTARCRENLRGIGRAVEAWRLDHNGAWPQPAGSRLSARERVETLDVLLADYVESAEVFRCPDEGRKSRWYERSGSSYLWVYQSRIPDAGEAARFYTEPGYGKNGMPLVQDRERNHHQRTKGNVLYVEFGDGNHGVH